MKSTHNDNGRSLSPFANDNEKKTKHDYVDQKAHYLMLKLNSEDSHQFYCKVAYILPERIIDQHLETALSKGQNPAKYFSFLAKRELDRYEK